ncbi:DUF3099 domain-containing protein [Pseudoteredinibacter isoporae]|uniref:Uncharacterized protein n=1 Tax=Pseudoteredinibacter isoporae TaxID=570281 RepID=A0A7X0JSF2_9GAMM|nr:DUF3099 domain-containing protein [Pseudoteredinibacter isoporae]MBB6520823.1 hypothetical protein [Pseudoteredinibacter isoporae]NHO86389.1 DUF3099 domain-containing protein [Pseudoteredinibacter isoporae]NIB25159.1 DUF3099 domain-containing protein [Pseudoteredinibacter isoporae]
MNSTQLIWLVGFITYLPLHLGLPLLLELIRQGSLPTGYKRYLWQGGLLTLLVFVAAYFLSRYGLWWALLCIVISMPLPWIQLGKMRKG